MKNSDAPAAGGALVLVVDDNDLVRRSLCAMLQVEGHVPLAAASGREALEIYADRGSERACILLDDTMPDMNGAEVPTALRALSSTARVLMCSGHADDFVDLADTPDGLLSKPSQFEELQAAVSACIARD